MNDFFKNSDRSRAMITSSDEPFHVAVNEVQSLANKLDQMNAIKPNDNYANGKSVLEHCTARMTKSYENNFEITSENDENLGDDSLNSSFGQQFVG